MSQVTKSSKTSKNFLSAKRSKQNQQPYGDLISLNTSRILLDAVGENRLGTLCKSRVRLLNTSGEVATLNRTHRL